MKTIVIASSLLFALSATSADAATMHRRHLVMAASPAPTVVSTAEPTAAENHQMYLRNLRASGYNPKNDFNAVGNMAE